MTEKTAEPVITCPHCGKEIHLTEALSHRVQERLRAECEQEARRRAEENFGAELEDLRGRLDEKAEKLREAQKVELALRRQQRELEEKRQALELEVTRRIDQEREKLTEQITKRVTEERMLRDLEKDKQLSDMRHQIEDLKRKAEQGSPQMQGEVLELKLEDVLRSSFPYDRIEPVPKGIKGADILQKVYHQSGRHCGTITWESKRTKAWNDQWLPKLKDDQMRMRAEIAVLVTTVLPKDVSRFDQIDGVWVTDFPSVVGLATALRMNLIQVAAARTAAEGKKEKMEILYHYLSGPEFRQRVEAMVEAFVSMKNELDQEKRAIERTWAKREKQIGRVIQNLAGMYGDVQGIVGASLPQLKILELPAGEGSLPVEE